MLVLLDSLFLFTFTGAISDHGMKLSFLLVLLLLSIRTNAQSSAANLRWWPPQAMPNALVRTTNRNDVALPAAARDMMVQSVAGLAAKAVNEGRGDEMVWVDSGNIDVED